MLRAWAVGLAAVAALAPVTAPTAPAFADSARDQQMWVLDAVHAPAAWRVTRGQGVVVAVVDSGVNPDVSDLAGSVIGERDFTGTHTSRSDPDWGVHGTWMASLIAGHGHDGGSSGILGVAPAAKILSIRVLADKGDPAYGPLSRQQGSLAQAHLAKAITYAAAHHARVISMSLGNDAASQVVRTALQDALSKGVVVVASAGNSGDSSAVRRGLAPYSFPADYPGVLGVAAVRRDGTPAGFSSANMSVQVAAPGVDVPAQGRNGGYWLVTGTSPACALAAGAAALIKAKYPGLAPAMVIRAITMTARNRPSGGYDDRVGFGTVDAAAALAAAARLNRYGQTGRGVAASAHFGGGPAAVPPVPVPPRGGRGLLVCAALALASALCGTAAASRLARRRRRAVVSAPPPATGPSR